MTAHLLFNEIFVTEAFARTLGRRDGSTHRGCSLPRASTCRARNKIKGRAKDGQLPFYPVFMTELLLIET
jgi:hypothetical protein